MDKKNPRPQAANGFDNYLVTIQAFLEGKTIWGKTIKALNPLVAFHPLGKRIGGSFTLNGFYFQNHQI